METFPVFPLWKQRNSCSVVVLTFLENVVDGPNFFGADTHLLCYAAIAFDLADSAGYFLVGLATEDILLVGLFQIAR